MRRSSLTGSGPAACAAIASAAAVPDRGDAAPTSARNTPCASAVAPAVVAVAEAPAQGEAHTCE